MSLIRFIIYCVIAYFVFRLLDRLFGKGASTRSSVAVPSMVKCHNCGLFVAEKDAIASGGARFCSRECARAGA